MDAKDESAMSFHRHTFNHEGLRFSYLDSGVSSASVDRPALIALHAHLMQGTTYSALAESLAPDYRVIALDQRGHGDSSHAATYAREDYIGDIEAFLAFLDLSRAVLLGNSLGGVNAYQFAARHPDRMQGLIVEDIGAVVKDEVRFVLSWQGIFSTQEELEAKIGPRFVPYLRDSFRHSEAGWHLAFDPRDMVISQQNLVGDHWSDWLASTCPALLLRGHESRVTSEDQVKEMAARRPNTRLIALDGGHALHTDSPSAFNAEVRNFLDSL